MLLIRVLLGRLPNLCASGVMLRLQQYVVVSASQRLKVGTRRLARSCLHAVRRHSHTEATSVAKNMRHAYLPCSISRNAARVKTMSVRRGSSPSRLVLFECSYAAARRLARSCLQMAYPRGHAEATSVAYTVWGLYSPGRAPAKKLRSK